MWCKMCKKDVNPITKKHPTLELPTLTCPICDSTFLKDKK